MFKRLLFILLPFLLAFSAAQAEMPSSRLYDFSREAIPAEIAEVFSTEFGSGAVCLSGYATMRFGVWQHGQAILQDEQGYILCALQYQNDAWQLTASRAALFQDRPGRSCPKQSNMIMTMIASANRTDAAATKSFMTI